MLQRLETQRQPWHNKHGFIHRLREAYWIMTKKQSLHCAWQAGFDDGQRSEHHRLITNKAYIAETKQDRAAA